MDADKHNALMQKFIRGTLREMLDGGGTSENILLMLESITFGVMLLHVKLFKMSPQVAAALAEATLAAAIERFTAEMNSEAGTGNGRAGSN